jgi:hypothetical protein
MKIISIFTFMLALALSQVSSAFADAFEGNRNTFYGQGAGTNTVDDDDCTFIGRSAGYSNTSGNSNTFIGNFAGNKNTTGNDNTFLGNNTGINNTTGYSNTFLGVDTGRSNTTGRNNTILGYGAGYTNTTGNGNTYVGRFAGRAATGSNNVFIGYSAGYNETRSNRLYIDNSSTSSPLIYGDFGANTLQFNGSVNITGSLTKGSGSFVQPHPTDPKKELVYAFFEGPEHAVFFRGKARQGLLTERQR